MSSGPRIPLVEPGTRPELAAIERTILAERGHVNALYQALLNSVPLAEGWEKLFTAIRNRGSLPPALREMVMLRVAVLNRAPFEFQAHRPIAREVGVTEEKIVALERMEIAEPLDESERSILALTDAMTRDVQVSDAVFRAVARRFGPKELVELVATIAAYNMVSRFLEAMRIGH